MSLPPVSIPAIPAYADEPSLALGGGSLAWLTEVTTDQDISNS